MSIPTELMDQNPWWRKPDAILRDKYIMAMAKSRVQWDPRLRFKFDLETDAVYTLRGPRQVGKTTLIKNLIRHLIESGVSPRNILYFACDLIDSPKALAETISSYLAWIRPSPKRRAFLLIDEVSSVENWQKAVKFLADKGNLASTTLILTGSHTLDIKKASERLPGRRGQTEEALDKIMLPMKFSEYAETLSKEISDALREQHMLSWDRRKEFITTLLHGEIPEEVKELSFLSKDLQSLFRSYLVTGGVARVVDYFLRHNEIPESIYKTYVDVVLGDLTRWGRRESYLRQVISRVIATLGSPVGWNTLKQDTDIAHHNTVADYVDTLVDSFVLLYLHRYDASRQCATYQKEKRIHFHDPFFLHAMRSWTIGSGHPFESTLEFLKNPENVGYLVEGIAANHLTRLAFHLCERKQLFSYENTLFYWRGKKDREVDFVLRKDAHGNIPLEVKYQKSINNKDLYGIIDFLKASGTSKGIVLSKDTLEIKRSLTIVPIWLFLILV